LTTEIASAEGRPDAPADARIGLPGGGVPLPETVVRDVARCGHAVDASEDPFATIVPAREREF
jgi:hypothetical protein